METCVHYESLFRGKLINFIFKNCSPGDFFYESTSSLQTSRSALFVFIRRRGPMNTNAFVLSNRILREIGSSPPPSLGRQESNLATFGVRVIF